ncbi:polymerase delta-interacting protein 3-like isoform X1 [Pieris napi]|uniref:polymerase delta-interacting protein 3-like isoform X1 n=1 Tax=Pieris napi TaxID=78633 RepID=UPI001FB91D60|nr:polymerase delta-interacting protein 3-like isoform X1 [Pieris napi]
MASYVDMSLDDIIQKKKRGSPKKFVPKRLVGPVRRPAVLDARNKILSKKRTQIKDAREKLIEIAQQKDARLKLQQLRAKKGITTSTASNSNSKKYKRLNVQSERVFSDPSRLVVSQPLQTRQRQTKQKRFMEERLVAPKSHLKLPLKPIVRTIENDLEIIDDPMGDDYGPTTAILANRKTSLQLKIVTHNNDNQRMMVRTREKSPPRPPSILKKRPMAALKIDKKEQDVEKPLLEYRIIVSNLRDTVTGADIKELFGDVGGMLESRLVRPGTAEVIYKTVEDAQRAVDLYHTRQLDGQPMNCLLVTPRASNNLAKSSSKPALVSSNSNVEPDISTFHKVLFSNF